MILCKVSHFESLLPPSSMWKKQVSDTIFWPGIEVNGCLFLAWVGGDEVRVSDWIFWIGFWQRPSGAATKNYGPCLSNLFASFLHAQFNIPLNCRQKCWPPFVSIHFLLLHVASIVIFVTWKHHLRKHTAFILLAWGLGGFGVQFCAGHQREGMKPRWYWWGRQKSGWFAVDMLNFLMFYRSELGFLPSTV